MKINKIEIYNLNSLKGYWCIDLTDPEYAKSHNQFVIHGETGSGKTTILDAVTLALYGETPRQKTGTVEELMTKHTTESMASVTYECKKGRYKSTFTLRKTGNKLDGNIKRTFEIVNLDTKESSGNINAFKEIQKATQNIIQLDYEQFCRSILLAQGKFDTFISGEEKQRADILAKMSGINYKEIGSQIWIKAKKVIEQYKEIDKEIKQINLLSLEEEKEITDEINNIPDVNKDIDKEINSNVEEINWLKQLSVLFNEMKKYEQERIAYEKAAEEFADKKAILERGEKALNCNGDFQRYNQLVDSDLSDNEALSRKNNKFEQLIKDCTVAENEAKEAGNKYKNLKNKKAENENLWKKVRELNTKISAAETVVTEACNKKDEAESDYSSAAENVDHCNKLINSLNEEIKEYTKYLNENSEDEKLENVLSLLEGKKESAEKNIQKISAANNGISSAEIETVTLKKSKTESEEQLNQAHEELKTLVSTEYLSISLLLRNKIENGKACPVCGSVEHPFCDADANKQDADAHHEINNEKNQDASQVAAKVAELNSRIEEISNDVNEYEKSISAQENIISQAEKEIDQETKELKETENEINTILKKWNLSVSFSLEQQEKEKTETLDGIFSQLKEKSKIYNDKAEKKQAAENQLSENKNKVSGINLDNLKKRWNTLNDEYTQKNKDLISLNKEIFDLFGDKDVDEEQEAYNTELSDLETQWQEAEQKQQTINLEKSGVEGEITQLQKRIDERKPELEKAQTQLEAVLKKNGFASKEELAAYLCSSEELEDLREISENLKTENTATSENKSNSEKKYNEWLKQKQKKWTAPDLTADENAAAEFVLELTEKNDALKTDKDNNSKRLGELNQQIQTNEASKQLVDQKKKKQEEMKAEAEKWEKIQKIIGNKDGESFQVFVEALAFKNLLKKANKSLEMISGKYKLVQVPGKVDFKIHDENFPDSKEDRPVTNMSGGERFIISLSLALGIAEIASKNVKVDSLFLDEGFGTLSGQPLYESINALKALQTSGKMLGIITHVNEVINSFDQRIEASPTRKNGGYSQLQGAGISYKEKWE